MVLSSLYAFDVDLNPSKPGVCVCVKHYCILPNLMYLLQWLKFCTLCIALFTCNSRTTHLFSVSNPPLLKRSASESSAPLPSRVHLKASLLSASEGLEREGRSGRQGRVEVPSLSPLAWREHEWTTFPLGCHGDSCVPRRLEVIVAAHRRPHHHHHHTHPQVELHLP